MKKKTDGTIKMETIVFHASTKMIENMDTFIKESGDYSSRAEFIREAIRMHIALMTQKPPQP